MKLSNLFNTSLVKSIVVDDDIAVENSLYTQGRRGVAGTLFMHKVLGAAAQNGASLDEIDELAHAILPNIKTIAVALSLIHISEPTRHTNASRMPSSA